MNKLLTLFIALIFIFIACKPSDVQVRSAESEKKALVDIIEGGYPYASEDDDVLIDYADKIIETLSNPFVGGEERIKLAIELDELQHPNLPPVTFPEVSIEIVSRALDKVKNLYDLSVKYYQLGEMEVATNLSQQVIREYEKVVGPDSENLLLVLSNLGFLYAENEQVDEAEATYHRGVNIVKMRHGDGYKESYHYAIAVEPLVNLYVAQFEYAKAKPLAEQVLTTFEKFLGPNHHKNGPILVSLGEIYQAESMNKEGEDSLLRAINIYQNMSGKNEETYELHVEALEALSTFYEVDYYVKSQNSEVDYEYIWEKGLEVQEQAKKVAVVFLGLEHPYTKKLEEGKSIHSTLP